MKDLKGRLCSRPPDKDIYNIAPDTLARLGEVKLVKVLVQTTLIFYKYKN